MARQQPAPGQPARRQQLLPGSQTQTAAQQIVANSQQLRYAQQNQYLQAGVGGASSRQNRYGTADPYARGQSSTNQNPYVGLAWLGSGFPHPLPTAPPQVPMDPVFRPLQYGGSRPSYDLAGIAALLGPYYHIPISYDFNLLAKLRQAIPMISAAIKRLKELVGFPEIQASPNLKLELEEWLRTLPVNRLQRGASNWMQSHIDNMATFGRAHAEVILNNARDDIHSLVEVDTRTLGLRPTFGGIALNVVQYQYGGGVPVTLIPELLLTSVNDLRGDDANGTPMIAELPFVGQILNSMLRSMGETADRFGVPTYHINWKPPDTWEDPTGAQTDTILGGMMGNLSNAIRDRAQGKANDFATAGDVTIDILGAAGEELRFEAPGRMILEQICASFGLPPFLYGFSWASTERMSTAQAKAVVEVIQSLRSVVTPAIEKLINLKMLITGRRGSFKLDWQEVGMTDLIDEARAKLMEAQAEETVLRNLNQKIRIGFCSLEEAAIQLRPDLAGIGPDQVRRRLNGQGGLPKLVEELPPMMAEPYGGEAAQSGGAAGGPNTAPGRDQTLDPDRPGRTPGGMPREESTRALVNGNGRR